MPLTDRKVLTFDVVGTLIDFETGILDYVQGKSKTASAQAILEAYAIAEDHQHHETPRLPFPSMMAPMYREMAGKARSAEFGRRCAGFSPLHPALARLPGCRHRIEAPA